MQAQAEHASRARERLGLDCDNVLADMDGYLLDRVYRRLGIQYRRESTWPFHLAEALPPEAAAAVTELLGQPDPWSEVRPYPDVARHIERLAERYELYVITSLPLAFASLREAWLYQHGIRPTRLIIASRREKARVAAELGLCAMVEDLGSTTRELAERGIDCYLIQQPWNEADRSCEGVYPCTWADLVELLLARPYPESAIA